MGDFKLKQTQSMRSVCSIKTLRSGKSALDYNTSDKTLQDLEAFIATACMKFSCPCRFVVKKDLQTDECAMIRKQEGVTKYKKISMVTPFVKQAAASPTTDDIASETTCISDDEIAITIRALHDAANRLVEISLNAVKVPLILMQILGLILPHYTNLTKITIKRCGIKANIIYELNKLLSLTAITDICLDGSPVPERNYVLLLEKQSNLMNLSLCRCNIDDEACKQIAIKLQFSQPAEVTLSTLKLSSNRITDVGAKHLGEALRTNRHLRYLNLADNQIGDEGANHIFEVLINFPMTYEEIMSKRRSYMQYLRTKQGVYLKHYMKCDSSSLIEISTISKRSKKSATAPLKPKAKGEKSKLNTAGDDFARMKAEMMADELVGPFKHPFLPSDTKVVDDNPHCIGNTVLCYLNLAYNNLSYLSLKKLQSVLLYQSANKKPNQMGLLRVVVDGNRLPVTCNEMNSISEMLHRNVVNYSGKYMADKRKRKISMIPEKRK